jgi:hypothetical protein
LVNEKTINIFGGENKEREEILMSVASIKRPISDKSVQLSSRQLKLLSNLLNGHSFEEACRISRVAKSTGYTWMRQPLFKDEYEQRKTELYTSAFEKLVACTDAAVKAYTGLLLSENENIRARVSEGIMDRVLKFKEETDLASRIEALENMLAARQS